MKPYNRPNGGACRWDECEGVSVGKSRFCIMHRDSARTLYIARIREQVALRESQREENEAFLSAAEIAAENAKRGSEGVATPPCLIWIPRAVGSLQNYLKREAGFAKAAKHSTGLELECSSLAYALAFQSSINDSAQLGAKVVL